VVRIEIKHPREEFMKIALIVVVIAAVAGAILLARSCDQNAGTDATTAGESPAAVTHETAEPTDSGEAGRLVSVGEHSLHIRTFGYGSPAVVIESGIGDAASVWQPVIDRLRGETRVVMYDRAGYGQSEPGPMPRSADRVAGELTRLLVNTPVEPPYVVVGHSLGAIFALLYTSEHPNLVAGLVLLDPPPLGFIKGERFPELLVMAEQMTAGFRRDAETAREAGEERQAIFLETVASEHEQMFESGWSWIESVRSLDDKPLVVVASGVPNPEFGASAEAFQRFWRTESEALTRLSSRSRFVFVEDSTHDLPGNATAEVVDAVLWCIEASQNPPEYEAWQGEK
jgi:pimeloyl-ACP methyl ester carboxylesterase